MLDLERVDLRSLAEALEDHSPETTWWFDPQTGETEPYFADPVSAALDEEEEDWLDRGLIRIEPIPSREAYGDMEDFIDRVRDPRARDLLERAIAGRGAFRRFKDTLLDFQGLRERSLAEREALSREDPQLPELASGFDPVEVATAVAGDLRALYGGRLCRVLLFGSWARGDAHPESDIDLLVVLDRVESPWEELRRMDEILWRHSYRNDAVISAVPVGEDELGEAARPLLIRAQTEGRAVA